MGGKIKLNVKSGVVANEGIKPFLNAGSCPGCLPMHQNRSFPERVRQEGREGPLASLFPRKKEPDGACAKPRPAPLTGEGH